MTQRNKVKIEEKRGLTSWGIKGGLILDDTQFSVLPMPNYKRRKRGSNSGVFVHAAMENVHENRNRRYAEKFVVPGIKRYIRFFSRRSSFIDGHQ